VASPIKRVTLVHKSCPGPCRCERLSCVASARSCHAFKSRLIAERKPCVPSDPRSVASPLSARCRLNQASPIVEAPKRHTLPIAASTATNAPGFGVDPAEKPQQCRYKARLSVSACRSPPSCSHTPEAYRHSGEPLTLRGPFSPLGTVHHGRILLRPHDRFPIATIETELRHCRSSGRTWQSWHQPEVRLVR
jgi:hypothetical protein